MTVQESRRYVYLSYMNKSANYNEPGVITLAQTQMISDYKSSTLEKSAQGYDPYQQQQPQYQQPQRSGGFMRGMMNLAGIALGGYGLYRGGKFLLGKYSPGTLEGLAERATKIKSHLADASTQVQSRAKEELQHIKSEGKERVQDISREKTRTTVDKTIPKSAPKSTPTVEGKPETIAQHEPAAVPQTEPGKTPTKHTVERIRGIDLEPQVLRKMPGKGNLEQQLAARKSRLKGLKSKINPAERLAPKPDMSTDIFGLRITGFEGIRSQQTTIPNIEGGKLYKTKPIDTEKGYGWSDTGESNLFAAKNITPEKIRQQVSKQTTPKTRTDKPTQPTKEIKGAPFESDLGVSKWMGLIEDIEGRAPSTQKPVSTEVVKENVQKALKGQHPGDIESFKERAQKIKERMRPGAKVNVSVVEGGIARPAKGKSMATDEELKLYHKLHKKFNPGQAPGGPEMAAPQDKVEVSR